MLTAIANTDTPALPKKACWAENISNIHFPSRRQCKQLSGKIRHLLEGWNGIENCQGQIGLPECFLPLSLAALNNIKMQTWLRSQLIRALKHALDCKHV